MSIRGVGMDLVDVEEAERLLERWDERLLRRVLTDSERRYVLRFTRPAKYLAVRLAAKEAVYKALQGLPGARGIGWREIEVVRSDQGRPTVRLHGRAREITEARGGVRISLSLSHTERTAGAMAIVEAD